MGPLEELFSDPSRWTKEVTARNAQGKHVSSRGADACSFCLIGGTLRIYGPTGFQCKGPAEELSQAIRRHTDGKHWHIEVFNDAPETTHGDILAVVRDAGL